MGSTDKKSYFGNMVHKIGDMVGWYPHKQSIGAASLTNAEYVFDACKDDRSLHCFLGDIVKVLTPITIYTGI